MVTLCPMCQANLDTRQAEHLAGDREAVCEGADTLLTELIGPDVEEPVRMV